MIRTRTLFILGAGASAPFGFPTSHQLRDAILNRENDSDIINAFNILYNNPNIFPRKLDDFINEFAGSGVYSIDSFLEYRTEFMDIGKASIAAYLINHEDDKKLRHSSDNNWYMYLFDRLRTSFEELDQNNISFITFNYDRSLEQFLYEAIRCRFGKKPLECVEKMNKIPIVHLYGQLDLLPWQDKIGKGYSPTKDLSDRLRNAAKNIKLISDERDVANSEEFNKAYDLIKKAERIYFLGFSFDETNLKRLDIKLMKSKRIVSTAYGLEQSKLYWVQNYFRNEIDSRIVLHERMDALSLLKSDLTIE
jgi:hypothetical protein